MAWYSRLGAFSGVTWHAGVVSGGVWWGSSTAVTLRMRLATAVTWRAVGDGGDVAVGVDENTLTWPSWAFVRGTAGTATMAGWWDGGGRWNRCDGSMFGNHLLPNIEIINNQYLNF